MKKSCELILALDVESRKIADDTLDKLGSSIQWVKVGLQLFTECGPSLIHDISARGYKIFLDLKLHDIGNTVAKSVKNLCQLPIHLTTLHTMGGAEMLSEANKARLDNNPELILLGVTVLTSMDQNALTGIGINNSTETQVIKLAKLGVDSGLQGLVCSPLELSTLRKELPRSCVLVTPGIRPSGSDLNDQKRAATPGTAAREGSSYIVVGRPILSASNPIAVIKSIQEELVANSN